MPNSRDSSPVRKLKLEDQIVKWLGEEYRAPTMKDGRIIDWGHWEAIIRGSRKQKEICEIFPDGDFPYPVVIFLLLENIWRTPPFGSTEVQLLCNAALGLCANPQLRNDLFRFLPELVETIAPNMMEMTFWSLFNFAQLNKAPWAQFNFETKRFSVTYSNLKTDRLTELTQGLRWLPSTRVLYPQRVSKMRHWQGDHPIVLYIKAFVGDAADFLVTPSSKSCRFTKTQFILDLTD